MGENHSEYVEILRVDRDAVEQVRTQLDEAGIESFLIHPTRPHIEWPEGTTQPIYVAKHAERAAQDVLSDWDREVRDVSVRYWSHVMAMELLGASLIVVLAAAVLTMTGRAFYLYFTELGILWIVSLLFIAHGSRLRRHRHRDRR